VDRESAQHCGSSDSTKRLRQRLAEEVERSHREGVPLALVFLAVDVPATRRPVPDPVTEALALLSRTFVGEGEAVVALPGGRLAVVANSSGEDAARLARRLASELQSFQFTCAGRDLDLRVRAGFACLGDGMGPGDLLEAAERALGDVSQAAARG